MWRLALQSDANMFPNLIRYSRSATHVLHQIPRARSPLERASEQRMSVRGKPSPRVSPGNSALKAKGTTKVCAHFRESILRSCLPTYVLFQTPRTRSPLDRTPEEKISVRGKVSYRSPSGSPLSKAKGTPKV